MFWIFDTVVGSVRLEVWWKSPREVQRLSEELFSVRRRVDLGSVRWPWTINVCSFFPRLITHGARRGLRALTSKNWLMKKSRSSSDLTHLNHLRHVKPKALSFLVLFSRLFLSSFCATIFLFCFFLREGSVGFYHMDAKKARDALILLEMLNCSRQQSTFSSNSSSSINAW